MKMLITALFTIFITSTAFSQEDQAQIPEEFLRSILDTETEDEDQKGIAVGELFSDSTFITIQGNEFSFVDSKSDITIVDFWFKGCRGCAQEKSYVRALIEKYRGDERIRFVAITPSKEKQIDKVIEKYGDYYDNIISVEGFKNCENLFRFKSFPRHYIISGDGKVLAQYRAPIFHPVLADEYEKRILGFLEPETD